MKKSQITPAIVKHIASLANIPVSDKESTSLSQAFIETLEVVDKLQKIDTSKTEPTHQVTGFENILREDTIQSKQMFTQKQALANAKKSHNGYFVVSRVLPS